MKTLATVTDAIKGINDFIDQAKKLAGTIRSAWDFFFPDEDFPRAFVEYRGGSDGGLRVSGEGSLDGGNLNEVRSLANIIVDGVEQLVTAAGGNPLRIEFQDTDLQSVERILISNRTGTAYIHVEPPGETRQVWHDLETTFSGNGPTDAFIQGAVARFFFSIAFQKAEIPISIATTLRAQSDTIINGANQLEVLRDVIANAVLADQDAATDPFLPENASINGTTGADDLTGTDGQDIIRADGNSPGEGASDSVMALKGDDFVFAGPGNDVVFGGGGADFIQLGQGEDRAFGGAGKDVIFGGLGSDTLFGGKGGDLLYDGRNQTSPSGEISDAEDFGGRLTGGKGNDTIFGFGGDDSILGNRGKDALFGGQGDDDIRGGRGADSIRAGIGDDMIRTGPGRDIVQVARNEQLEFGNDIVIDFNVARDILDIRAFEIDDIATDVVINETVDGTTISFAGGLSSGTLFLAGTSGVDADNLLL